MTPIFDAVAKMTRSADFAISQIGLAAKVPAYFVETIRTMGEDHDVTVEDDQTVSINSESP